MIFHRSTYEDIRKYYRDNIIKLPPTGDRLWQIVSITPEEVKFVDVDGFEIYISLDEEYEIDYPLPGRAIYQNGPYACLLARKPAKQYNRGLHKENAEIRRLSPYGEWKLDAFSLPKLQQFVDKPAYQDPHTIDWSSGYNSWAISKFFAITADMSIYALTKKIGSIVPLTKEINVNNLFKEEIKDLFPGWTVL